MAGPSRSAYLRQQKQFNTELANKLFNREITINQWRDEMRAMLRRTYKTQYAMGKGTDKLTQRDFGLLGNQLRIQYRYLNNFASDIANGKYLTTQAGMVAARQQLYAMSSNWAYERAKAEKYGPLQLPAMPGDGSTECLSNCKCRWSFRRLKNGLISASWQLGKVKERHCTQCPPRARAWKGLLFNAQTGEPAGEIEEVV